MPALHVFAMIYLLMIVSGYLFFSIEFLVDH